MTAESRAWMGALPRDLSFSAHGLRFRVLHGGVSRINRFVFASDRQALHEEFAQTDADVVIGGHAGIPFVAEVGSRVWFNPGVIGMPANDGTTDVWYGLIGGGADGVVLTTHRLTYDYQGAAASLRRAAFADSYATALTSGLWPSVDILPTRERLETGMALEEIRWRVSARTTSAATVVA
jgi:hypothetical protein